MAANVFSTITGSESSKVFTFLISGHKGRVILLVDYDKNTSTSIAVSPIAFLIPQQSGTLYYTYPASVASGQTLAAYTLTLNADGKFVIPIDNVPLEATKMQVTVADTGGTDAVIKVDAYTDVY